MTPNKTVEIFIPAYNAEHYIGAAIESALAQTYPHLRVVVVDNASTDATAAIAQAYTHDPRMELHCNPTNIGMTANLMRCVSMRGDGYFTILCADNLLKPHYAERLCQVFEANPELDVVTACTETLQMPEARIVGSSAGPSGPPRLLTPEEIIEKSVICFNAFLACPGLVFQFDPDFHYAPDEKLWREWAVQGRAVAHLPEVVAIYRAHADNMSKRTPFAQQLDEQLAAVEWIERDPSLAALHSASRRGQAHVCAYLSTQTQDASEQRILNRLIRQKAVPAAGLVSATTAGERLTRPRLVILGRRPDPARLAQGAVSYQMAQFLHLENYAEVTWRDALIPGEAADAVIVYDECALFTNDSQRRSCQTTQAPFIYIAHDWWCHPVRTAQFLRERRRAMLVLRHDSARQMFRDLVPEFPYVVQRPGVETSIFQPSAGPKQCDIILSGSETPDYPMRQKINRIVRENASRCGWRVLDMAQQGLMSQHHTGQCAYAPALAAAKISPTGTNRGGGAGATLVTQHLDHSPARALTNDPFYGLGQPDLITRHYDTTGITPRYLESLASKTLLIGDIPEGEAEEWYQDKMIAVTPEMPDELIVSLIDYSLTHDAEREELCNYAYQAVLASETSDHKARELAEIVARFLKGQSL